MNHNRNARIALAVVLALMIMCAGMLVTRANGVDGQRPVYPMPTCVSIEQAQCRALLTNGWDGRQVTHQLDPVPTCTQRPPTVLLERLERKNVTLAQLRGKVARLRARLAR